jgi:hypothetical protein
VTFRRRTCPAATSSNEPHSTPRVAQEATPEQVVGTRSVGIPHQDDVAVVDARRTGEGRGKHEAGEHYEPGSYRIAQLHSPLSLRQKTAGRQERLGGPA